MGSEGTERGSPPLRLLDWYAGVPAVALAGLVRRKRTLPEKIRRIGILKTYAIGDTVLLSAIAKDLAEALPEVEIVFISGRDNAGAAELIEEVTRVVAVPVSHPVRMARRIRAEDLDVLLDFGAWPRIEALQAALSGADFVVGFRTHGQYRHYAYDVAVPHSAVVHELENYRCIVGGIGVESKSPPRLAAPGAVPRADLPANDYIVFHLWPGGFRSHLKEWPLARWRDLAAKLVERGFAIVLTGGPGDRGSAQRFAELCEGLPRPVANGAGRFGIREVLDVLASSRGLISVNTGTMHIGAALGVPTVALNGPTSAVRWGPIGEHTASVNSPYEGCGYLNLGSEYGGRREDCMAGITVEAVLDATSQVVGFAS